MNINISDLNQKLQSGEIEAPGLFPKLEQIKTAPFVFEVDFGLKKLPTEPGIISIRGARQYGKSTWLEQSLKQSIIDFGPGSAFYLNGDHLLSIENLEQGLQHILPCFRKDASTRRIFIDEITAIPNWEIALKRAADRGLLRDVLVVTTGSSAADLRRGIERLPGRKGKLARTHYLFTPLAYKEFHRVCYDVLKEKTWVAYLLSGGSPVACAELAAQGYIPDYVIELTRDWVYGEILRTGRNPQSLQNIFSVIYKFACTPVGQAKLAREANLANNTVAAGYISILNDLGVVNTSYAWDAHKKLPILRKPCKYHFTNLLAAASFYPNTLRRIDDFLALNPSEQSHWLEWLVAQELTRRSAIAGKDILHSAVFWQNEKHEIDFLEPPNSFFEVKRGPASPLEFTWFTQQFPRHLLTVINPTSFETEFCVGKNIETFLLDD